MKKFDEAKALRSRIRIVPPPENTVERSLWRESKPNPLLAICVLACVLFWLALGWYFFA